MTKNLHKEIMKRLRLKNKYLKSKSLTNRKNSKRQLNNWKELLRTIRKEYFNNIDIKKVTGNRNLGRTVVPLFSNKNSKNDKIILNKDGRTVSDEKVLCRTFSTYFANTVFDLQIPKIHEDVSNIRSNHDFVLDAVNSFKINRASLILNIENLT